MRLPRALMVLGLAFTIVTVGAGCRDILTPSNREILEPPLGLSSAPGNGSVTPRWPAGNPGEGRRAFDIYPAGGPPASTPGESIPPAFGTAAGGTLTTDEGTGSLTSRRKSATLVPIDGTVSSWRER